VLQPQPTPNEAKTGKQLQVIENNEALWQKPARIYSLKSFLF
jgi:hypothetical protein